MHLGLPSLGSPTTTQGTGAPTPPFPPPWCVPAGAICLESPVASPGERGGGGGGRAPGSVPLLGVHTGRCVPTYNYNGPLVSAHKHFDPVPWGGGGRL